MRRLLALLALGPSLSSCAEPAPMPGTPLGTYTIQAAISQNTCGAGTGAPDPWTFDVELSREPDQLHWRQKGVILSGSLDDARQAKITSTQRGQVGNDGKANCSMERTDTVLVTLGQEDPPTLSGTISFSFKSDGSAACEGQLLANGGIYTALPCQLTYAMTAHSRGP